MEKFTTLTGVAAPLPMVNVDTDAIIPKQYLKTIKRTGLSAGLFHEMRTDRNGVVTGDFVLDKPAYREANFWSPAKIFGCGSSRQSMAPGPARRRHPLRDLDTLADIFFNNCFKNGILPVTLPQEDVDALMADAQMGANATMTVDLEAQTIARPNGETVAFEVEPFRKHCLLNGLDDIGLSLQKAASIDSFEAAAANDRPWMTPAGA